MDLIDSHCHLDAIAFDADRTGVLARCRASGIKAIVVPGVRRPDFPTLKAVCASSPMLHAAYGLHPLFLAHHQ
ncbi:MAG: TatD family hydrolase, partial [Gammaproteobacteria bacterium]